MATSTNSLVWNILAKDQASKTFDKVGDSAEKAGHKGRAFGLALAGAAGAGVAALGAVIKTGYGELQDYQAGLAQAQAVVKSTGGAAGVSAKHVEDLASSIQNYSGQTDDSIVAGENLLLTFTNIRNEAGKGNDVFDQSTKILADMSQALGQDTKTSAIQLGKALNDPIKGITALQKVGVSFSDAQKTTIKRLQETGHSAEAQKVILKELNREFGGSAKAFGESGPGQIARSKRAFEDLSQSIVQAVLPTLTSAAGFMNNYVLPALSKVGNFLANTLSPVFSAIGNAFGDFTGGLQGTTLAAGKAWTIFRDLGLGVSAMFAAMKDGDVTSDGLVGKFEQVGAFIHNKLVPAFKQFADFVIHQVVPAAMRLGSFIATNLVPIFEKVATFIGTRVIPTFAQIATFLMQRVEPAVLQIYTRLAHNLKPAFESLANFVTTRVIPAVQGLWARFQQVLPTLEKVGLIVLKVTGFFLGLAAKILGTVIPIVLRLAGPVFTALFATIGKVIGVVASFMSGAVAAFHAVGNAGSYISDKVSGAFNTIVRTVTGMPGRIASAASGMWDGLRDSFRSSVNWIIRHWNDLHFTIGGGSVFGQKLPSVTLNTPDIPYLAAGGIVTRPTIAMIGEAGPEAVIPLNRYSGGGGGDIHISINVGASASPHEVARATVNAIRRYKADLGGGSLGIA